MSAVPILTRTGTATTPDSKSSTSGECPDDTYLLNERRGSNANSWQSFTWDIATISGAIAGDAANETYTVEWVDTYSGGWGFAMIDDVVLNNVTLIPEPSTLALVTFGLAGLISFGRRRKQ